MTTNRLFFQIESLAVLAKSGRLDEAAATAAVEELLVDIRSGASGNATSANQTTAPEPSQTFASHARQAILESLNSGSPNELSRIHRVLENRWSERRTQLQSPVHADAVPTPSERGWEHEMQVVAAKLEQATQAAGRDRAEAAAALQEWDGAISAVQRRLATQEHAASQDNIRTILSSPLATAALAAIACGSLAVIGGQSLGAVLFLSLGGAALSVIARILLRTRAAQPSLPASASSRLSRQLLQPAADALVRHYASLERATHADLECARYAGIVSSLAVVGTPLRDVEQVAADFMKQFGRNSFHPVDEGKVLIFGGDIARQLVASRRGKESSEFYRRILVTFREQTGSSLAAATGQMSTPKIFAALKAAAAVHTASFSLADAIAAVCQRPEGKRQLWDILDVLHRAASSAVRLKRGLEFEIDHTLSPANCMFGLPTGPQDPLAQVIRERFPDATFFHSFDREAIEIYFDRRNLSRTHLLWDELSQYPYEQAPAFERQSQWHFPRRLRGGPEPICVPDQVEAAAM